MYLIWESDFLFAIKTSISTPQQHFNDFAIHTKQILALINLTLITRCEGLSDRHNLIKNTIREASP